VTANNITYALLGELFHYWDFFPTESGLGLVPLWGFADVMASRANGVEVGGRVYGYLPPASHLLVRPGRVDARGFRDASAHRQALPSPYNVYAMTTGDPAYEAHREDLLVLYRQLSGGQAIPASSVTLATGQAAPDADDLVGGRLVQREQHRTASGPGIRGSESPSSIRFPSSPAVCLTSPENRVVRHRTPWGNRPMIKRSTQN